MQRRNRSRRSLGRRSRRSTVGQNPYRKHPTYGTLWLDQRDRMFPKPYVHKVGTVGKPGGLFESLGITTGQPGLYEMVGVEREDLAVGRPPVRQARNQQPDMSGEVVCIDPEIWNERETIYENVGRIKHCTVSGNNVQLSYYPVAYDAGVAAEKYIPANYCIVCVDQEDFLNWACEIVDIDEGELIWQQMFGYEDLGTTGGGYPGPF